MFGVLGVVVVVCFAIWLRKSPNAMSAKSLPEEQSSSDSRVDTPPETPNSAGTEQDAEGFSHQAEVAMRSSEQWNKLGFVVEQGNKVETDLDTLKTLLIDYRRTFGDYPRGGSDAFINGLSGENPRKIKFMAPKGEFLDPWKMPYQFTVNDETRVLEIRSAGPDRLFWTKDDVISQLDKQ